MYLFTYYSTPNLYVMSLTGTACRTVSLPMARSSMTVFPEPSLVGRIQACVSDAKDWMTEHKLQLRGDWAVKIIFLYFKLCLSLMPFLGTIHLKRLIAVKKKRQKESSNL